MKLEQITLLLALLMLTVGVHAQSSFPLPGNGNWYKVADIGGQHGYLEYIYSHTTGNNPSIAKGEIQFINSMNSSVQHHAAMGYAAWNQPQFALLNFSGSAELWVKATNGVATGTFRIISSLNVNVANGSLSDSDLSNNGGTLTTYNKLADGAHTFIGDVKADRINVSNVTSNSLEIGGANPTPASGLGTLYLHHYGIIAHQLRYNNGSLYLEGAGNGYNTNTTPNFFVGGNVGIGTISPDARLTVKGAVHANEVKVDLNVPGPDYVFELTYMLPSLDSVQSYINQNKHLPEVPSAKEMEASGVNLGEMNMLLLKKVEELTLYMIDMKKRDDEQQKEISRLKNLIEDK